MSYQDDQSRRPEFGEEEQGRSVDPAVRERELEEMESGQRADRKDSGEADDDASVDDTDVPGAEAETSE